MADSLPEFELSERELRFCQEYAAEPNATQAYRRAFPKSSYRTAMVEGCKLLRLPKVQAILRVTRLEHSKRCRITALKVLKENAAIAFADYADLFEESEDGSPKPRKWGSIPIGTRKAIQSIKIKRKQRNEGTARNPEMWEVEEIEYKLNSKDASLERLCKHLGITSDTVVDELAALLANRTVSAKNNDAEIGKDDQGKARNSKSKDK